MYNKIGVAVAFSPQCEAIIGEAVRLQKLYDADLIFIHIGTETPEEKNKLSEMVAHADAREHKLRYIWEQGKTAKKILEIGRREHIDLLVAGALKQENLVKYYFGSVARKLIRKSACSILMLTSPQLPAKPFKKIVIDGTEGDLYAETIQHGFDIAKAEKADHVYIFKGIKLFGLSMALTGEEDSEQEQEDRRRELISREHEEIDKIIEQSDIGSLKIHVKIASGKPGYELRRFTDRIGADLLIVKSAAHELNLFDRLFPHHLEQIIEDLPTNLLIDKS